MPLPTSMRRNEASIDLQYAPTLRVRPRQGLRVEPSAADSALQPLAQELVAARAVHAEAISAAQMIFDGARGGAPVRHDVAERVVHNLNDTILRSPEASLLLMQARAVLIAIFQPCD